jgi:hypothetical protein
MLRQFGNARGPAVLNRSVGIGSCDTQHQARPRYARLASNQPIIKLAAPLWGLIDGSGHLGQHQIGRLPW